MEDIKIIVGELRGEFRGVNTRLDNIEVKVDALQTDLTQRKTMGKVAKWFFAIGSTGGVGAGLKAAAVSMGIIH